MACFADRPISAVPTGARTETQHAQPPAYNDQIRADGPPRFERREGDRLGELNLNITPDQQRVAGPAEAAWAPCDRRGTPWRVVEHCLGEDALAFAKPPVGFLQGDHVRVHLAQDGEDPLGIAPSVEAHRLVDVVAGERQLHAG